MALSADLRALKALLGTDHRDPDVRAKPRVGPRLRTTFQPFHLGPVYAPCPTDEQLVVESGLLARAKAKVPCPRHSDVALALDQAAEFFSGLRGPKDPETLGLSMARNLDEQVRRGLHGLPAEGRKKLSEALAFLEERRQLLSFWTVSLPTEAVLTIGQKDTWALFVQRLRTKLRRKLMKRLGVAFVVGVVEIQPKRSRALGVPCPHLHVVFIGRKDRGSAWAISPAELDEMIQSAAVEAGVARDICWATAGNVQQVKKSVRAYLSKYMTKGSQDIQLWVGTEWESLLPRQWWLCTRQLGAALEGATADLPTSFMAWVWRHRIYLQEEGFLTLFQFDLPPGVPMTFRIDWASVEDLALLIARWQEQQWDDLWQARAELGIYTTPSGFVYSRPATSNQYLASTFSSSFLSVEI